jgi:hypothetical protein
VLTCSAKTLHNFDKLANVYSADDESGFPLNNKPQNKASEETGAKNGVSQTCVERGENVTFVPCTNAVGNFILPFFFKGKIFYSLFSEGFAND